METNFRETQENDFEKISDLLEEAGILDQHFTKNRFVKMLGRNKGFCYVAEEDGRIVGSAFATHDGAFRAYIRKVVVARDYRRQGIAVKLIKKIIHKLAEVEIPVVFARVGKTNSQSVDLFKSLGFTSRDSQYILDINVDNISD
jgi:ribosomal protein S18 acetylase RimI-like enzyme